MCYEYNEQGDGYVAHPIVPLIPGLAQTSTYQRPWPLPLLSHTDTDFYFPSSCLNWCLYFCRRWPSNQPACPPFPMNSLQPSFLSYSLSRDIKKQSSFLTIHSHCSKTDSELKIALRQCDRFTKVELVPRRYGGVVEDNLDVYLRTPDLPKDDIARALVARGRARKGAGQRLLLMASRGPSRPFVVLNSYFADPVPSFAP